MKDLGEGETRGTPRRVRCRAPPALLLRYSLLVSTAT
jgi:hypothetical protein